MTYTLTLTLTLAGDDVEEVVRVCRLALEFRQRFGTDVVVDVVCYRKHGHQEADNPSFTQPAMCANPNPNPNPNRNIYIPIHIYIYIYTYRY